MGAEIVTGKAFAADIVMVDCCLRPKCLNTFATKINMKDFTGPAKTRSLHNSPFAVQIKKLNP